jgi:hypothetical protein
MSQKSQGMGDETMAASVCATVTAPDTRTGGGAAEVPREVASSSIMQVHLQGCDKSVTAVTQEALMGDRVKLTSMAKAAG